MTSQFIDTSFLINSLRKLQKKEYSLQPRIIEIYQNSRINRIIHKIMLCLKYSFLGRITEKKERANIAVVENSIFIKRPVTFYKKIKRRIFIDLKPSAVFQSLVKFKQETGFKKIKIISAVIITAIAANTFLSLLINKEIDLEGWILRGVFLVVAIVCLRSPLDFSVIKNKSIFLRLIFNNKCAESAEK